MFLANNHWAARQTGIHLNRRLGSAEAFTIEPRPIEAARAALPGHEHRAGIFDPTRASLWVLGGSDPVDPISARDGRDVRPQRPRLRGGRESLPQSCWHLWLRFLSRRRDLKRNDVAGHCARSFRSTLSQWPPWRSGSSVALKGKPLVVPSTEVMLREGSFALAFFGRVRKFQEPTFAVVAGRKSLALKRVLEAVLVICVGITDKKWCSRNSGQSRRRETCC